MGIPLSQTVKPSILHIEIQEVCAYQSNDGALGRELRRAEERPDEAVDEFVFGINHRIIIWNLFSLLEGSLSFIRSH